MEFRMFDTIHGMAQVYDKSEGGYYIRFDKFDKEVSDLDAYMKKIKGKFIGWDED